MTYPGNLKMAPKPHWGSSAHTPTHPLAGRRSFDLRYKTDPTTRVEKEARTDDGDGDGSSCQNQNTRWCHCLVMDPDLESSSKGSIIDEEIKQLAPQPPPSSSCIGSLSTKSDDNDNDNNKNEESEGDHNNVPLQLPHSTSNSCFIEIDDNKDNKSRNNNDEGDDDDDDEEERSDSMPDKHLLETEIRSLLMNNKNIQDAIIQEMLQNSQIPKEEDLPVRQDEMVVNTDSSNPMRSASRRISRAMFPSTIRLQGSKRRLPRDVFTLMALQDSSWWSNALVFLTLSLQLAFVYCLIRDDNLKVIFSADTTSLFYFGQGICQNKPTTVAYYLATIVALFHQHDLRVSWSLSKDGFHPQGQMDNFSTRFRWYLSISLRWLVGASSLFVAYVVIHGSSSTTVLEILLNLLAAEGIAGLDNHIFEWAIDGFFGPSIRRDATRATDVIYSMPSTSQPVRRSLENIKSAPIISVGLFSLCLFGLPVLTARMVFAYCSPSTFNRSWDCFRDPDRNEFFGKDESCIMRSWDEVTSRQSAIRLQLEDLLHGWKYYDNRKMSVFGTDKLLYKTPQSAAWKWLANEDGAKIDENDKSRLETRFSLATFYYSTCGWKINDYYYNGPDVICQEPWADRFGFLSEKHECNWTWANGQGVTCNSEDVVTSIIIDGKNITLSGSIPDEIRALSGLEELRLRNHRIESEASFNIPAFRSLSFLTNLRVLDLSGNQLEHINIGTFYSLTNLRMLDLSGNRLEESPAGWAYFPHLSELSLSDNRLGQTIPEQLATSTQLKSLDLSNNLFTGSIPRTFQDLKFLKRLWLNGNHLSGNNTIFLQPIIAGLEELRLDDNIGISIGDPFRNMDLSHLKVLRFQDVTLDMSFPETIGHLSNLQVLDLGNTGVKGTLPSDIGSIFTLNTLSVPYNYLSGSLPWSGMRNATHLSILNVSGNGFTGTIPYNLSTFIPHLEVLDVSWNDLEGGIPGSIGDVTTLERLDLSNNQLTGLVPSTLRKLTLLRELDLSSNDLRGGIPESIGNVTTLERLDLSNNQLTGSIPFTLLTQLTRLRELDLSWNQFSGTLPTELDLLTSLEKLALRGVTQLSGNLERICNRRDEEVSLVISRGCDFIGGYCSCCIPAC